MSMIDHKKRITTGLGLFAVFIVAVLLGGWPLRIVIALTAIFALYEFFSLFWPGRQQLFCKSIGMTLGALIVLAHGASSTWILGVLALAFVFIGFIFLYCYGIEDQTCMLTEFSPLILGLAYIPLLLHLALYMSITEQFLVLFAAIATDTGGYYAGNRFGKHKMWPRVSPQKSWEGSAGGLFACITVCTIVGIFGSFETIRTLPVPLLSSSAPAGLPPIPLWAWPVIGVFLNLAAQLGDFFESALKRSLHAKDSGTILPGHGGVLDRIDSLLFVMPVYMLFRTLFSLSLPS